MSELVTSTAKLLPYVKRSKAIPSFATAYYYEPDPTAEQVGTLFVVIEVMAPARQAEAVADLVIKSVGESYYNVPAADEDGAEEDADQTGSDPPAETASRGYLSRFEAAIKTLNEELAHYTERGFAGWVGRMSAVIAVLADGELHITQTGSAEGLLLRGGGLSRITTDLAPKGPHRPAHTFAHIASGQMHDGDRLVFGTPALLHILPEHRLSSLMTDNTPQAAAGKIASLVAGQDSADRVAGLLVEVTTPEVLAMSVSSGEPSEVAVGQPESLLDAAKVTAKPLMTGGLSTARRAATTASGWLKTRLLPGLRRTGLLAVAGLRGLLSHKAGRFILLGMIAVAIAGGAYLRASSHNSAAVDQLVQQYDTVWAERQQAAILFEAGDKISAKAVLLKAKGELDTIAKSELVDELEAKLASRPHPEDQPTKVAELAKQIQTQIDLLEGLSQASPTVIFDLGTAGAKPAQLELVGSNLVAIGEGADPSIYVFDTVTAKLRTAAKAPAGFGTAVASATSSAGDGILILTDQPGVWLYKPAGDSLVRQNASGDGWAAGRDIAAYFGNVYILADDQVWRYTPTITGFSAKQGYLPAATATANTAGATAMAIDGSVYLGGGQPALRRYLSGKLEQSAGDLPASLSRPKSVQSAAEGTSLLMLDTDSGRYGLVTFGSSELRFLRQIQFSGGKPLSAVYDERGKTLYILSEDNKLSKLPLSL